MDLGAPELLIILAIGLLIFGSNKLPKLARSLGQASKEFKSAASGWSEEVTAPEPVVTPPVITPAPQAPAAAPSTAAPSPAPAAEARPEGTPPASSTGA